jgi:uncharacterized membrane protein
MTVLADLSGLWVFLIVIGAFGIIAIVAFIIYRLLRPNLKGDVQEKKTEEDYAKEELDRILQPVDDEKVSKEIQDYKQENDEE